MAEVTIDQIADAMFELVKSTYGKKDMKPMDVTKAMIEQFGEDNVDKRMCKKALRQPHRLRPLRLQVCGRQLRDASRINAGLPAPRACARGVFERCE